ncbi:MAG: ROK family protein [Coprobacillus sp.]
MKKLVFDIGASAIKYALMNNNAEIYEKGKEITPHDNLDNFLSVLESIYNKYKNQINGIAISLPGTIDSLKGQIYAPGGLTYNENINLVDKIHQFTDLPVSLENDGKSAALAELWKGNLEDSQDGIVIVVGSGLGGGIVKDGKLLKGQHLFAGEFSYVYQGEGQTFMENAWAVRGSTTALIGSVALKKKMDFNELNGYEIFKMIHDGDKDANESLQEVAQSLAKGIYNLQCILDPKKILIGGGISQQPILIEKIKEELDKIYSFIPFDIPRAQIETCCFYNDSNLIGALYNYLNMYKESEE